MTSQMSIYHWKLGDIALARLCQKIYAKVQVVKNTDGIFFDDKVLGISANEDGSIIATEELCYYVEISRTKERLWLPYTSLHLAERSRPFYGPQDKILPLKPLENKIPRKRKIMEDHILPMNVKLTKHPNPDLNTTYDIRHMPLKQGKYENAFKEFVRRGKEMLFDHYFFVLQSALEREKDTLDYLYNVDASTEDKFELVMKKIANEKEVENYLHQCWRYNSVYKHIENKDSSDNQTTSPEKYVPAVHVSWCLVCGKGAPLRLCPACPAAFHPACRREWLLSIRHRKNPPQKSSKQTTLVEKILSSTRVISSVRREKENLELCPSCMWGPRVGYEDVIWHKLGTCSWWPARILPPGAVPSCLLARKHSPKDWPLQYYGTLNYSWAGDSRMMLFLPSHTAALASGRDPCLQQAVLDACDDYIAVYLT